MGQPTTKPPRVQRSIRVLPEVADAVKRAAEDLGRSESWVFEQGVLRLLGDRLSPHVQELSRLWPSEE